MRLFTSQTINNRTMFFRIIHTLVFFVLVKLYIVSFLCFSAIVSNSRESTLVQKNLYVFNAYCTFSTRVHCLLLYFCKHSGNVFPVSISNRFVDISFRCYKTIFRLIRDFTFPRHYLSDILFSMFNRRDFSFPQPLAPLLTRDFSFPRRAGIWYHANKIHTTTIYSM